MMLNLSDDDSFTNNTNHVNGNVKNEESPSKLMDSPSKRPNNVNEESTDCDADLLDSIFSQMASGKMSVTPGKINRPVKASGLFTKIKSVFSKKNALGRPLKFRKRKLVLCANLVAQLKVLCLIN